MRTPFFVAIALAVAMSAASSGCGGPLAEGEAQFSRGDYPQAKETFAALEPQARTWQGARRAQYALYRGLTLGALGDRVHGDPWLHEAESIERGHPGTLSQTDARRMGAALEAE